jgi:DoxX-like family
MQTARQIASDPTPQRVASTPKSNRKLIWAGRVISVLPAALLIFSGIMKLAKPPAIVQGFEHFGLPLSLATGLGILEISCAVIYLIPQTAVLGAILVTGYLGGATVTNVRVGEAWILPVLVGVLAWLGLFLRDERVRTLIPLRRSVR